MTVAPGRRRPRALFVALMSCALAAGVWLSFGREDATPPGGTAEVERAAPVSAPSLGDAAVARERAAAAPAAQVEPGSISGVLLDAGGAPIAHQRVFFDRAAADADARDGASSSLTFGREGPVVDSRWTGEDGRFSFDEVPPGALAVFAVSRECARADVVLAPGEHHDVTLQVASGLVHVRVELTRGGAPVEAAFLDVMGKGEHWNRNRLHRGVATCLLSPGRYDISLLPRHEATPARLTTDTIVVPAGVARQPFYVGVLGADVAIELEPAGDMEVGDWEVVASACIDGEDTTVTRESSGRKRPVLRFLPPGDWTVRVTGRGLLESPPQPLRVAPSDVAHRLLFPVRPGAIVSLTVTDERGRRLRVPPEFLPDLVAEGSSFACSGDDKEPHFPGVPAGDVALRCADRTLADEVCFLPFDEMPDVRANVALGAANTVHLDVVRRARVDLRVCERGGRECFGAGITVYAGDRRVRSLPVEQPQRFEAFLPPGDYRVVADRGGALREYTVTVGRETLRLRLRP